jgi:hypothetical protein
MRVHSGEGTNQIETGGLEIEGSTRVRTRSHPCYTTTHTNKHTQHAWTWDERDV